MQGATKEHIPACHLEDPELSGGTTLEEGKVLFPFLLCFSLFITISRGLHYFTGSSLFSNLCALLGILMLGLDDFIPLSMISHNEISTPVGVSLRDLHGEHPTIAYILHIF
jgi:hypothetical protein